LDSIEAAKGSKIKTGADFLGELLFAFRAAALISLREDLGGVELHEPELDTGVPGLDCR
jgi:hypothetical protein